MLATFTAIAATVLLAAACDNDKELADSIPAKYITVSTSIGQMGRMATAENGSQHFTAGDKINVYAWAGTTEPETQSLVVNGSTNTFDGTTWTAEPQMLWLDTDTPIWVKTGINECLNARAGYLGGEEPDYFYFSINQGAGKYSWRDVRMEKADGAWVPATLPGGELLLWASSAPTATVYAFTRGDDTTPLAATNAVPPSDAAYELALPDDQRTPEAVRQADILYCYKEGVNPADDDSISLDFDHAMSKLVYAEGLYHRFATLTCGEGSPHCTASERSHGSVRGWHAQPRTTFRCRADALF